MEPLRRSGRRCVVLRLAVLSAVAVTACSDAVVAPAAAANPRPAVVTQFHCLWPHYTNRTRATALNKLRRAGVRWVRIDVGWWAVEPHRRGVLHPWYLGQIDACVNLARRRGMQVLATLWGSPGWANGGRAK